MIRIKVLAESEDNFLSALVGMGLSHNKTIKAIDLGLDIFFEDDGWPTTNTLYNKMLNRAKKLAFKGGGHNKFLRAIRVDLIVQAPIDFWEQEATYTTVDANQSTSTMHTLKSKSLDTDFDPIVDEVMIKRFNELKQEGASLDKLKKNLPVGYLYTRTIHLNYMTLQNIYQQRHNHKLPEWREFCSQVIKIIKHPYFISKEY